MLITMTIDYDGSQILFRLAIVDTLTARKRAAQAAGELAARGQAMERQQRERDSVIRAIIMIQAAAEGYANSVHLRAGRDAKGPWISRWKNLPRVAETMGRNPGSFLGDHHQEFLEELGAWRQFFLHADKMARDRLRNRLVDSGQLADGQLEVELLTADMAAAFLKQADSLFRWAEKVTGITAPNEHGVWIAPDEY
jgi:hypothetical protein